MIKAVFIDIDETLTNSQRKITQKTKSEITRCVNKGIKIILASGRSRNDTLGYQKELGSSPYIISSNGASIYDVKEEKEIYNAELPKETVLKLLNYSIKNNYKINLNYKDQLVMNTSFFPDEYDKVRTNEELQNIVETEKIVQCVIQSRELEKIQIFKEYKEKQLPEIKIVNQSKRLTNPNLKPSKSYFCDITAVEVSKGKAIKAICDYLNINKEEIIAIGDGENDISMFDQTPNSVAMGNATDIVKEKAKYITCTNDEDGVAKILEQL